MLEMLKAFTAGCGRSGHVSNKNSKQKNIPNKNRLCNINRK